jgi:hypothetical protein
MGRDEQTNKKQTNKKPKQTNKQKPPSSETTEFQS